LLHPLQDVVELAAIFGRNHGVSMGQPPRKFNRLFG
jgi:hypothetical protein